MLETQFPVTPIVSIRPNKNITSKLKSNKDSFSLMICYHAEENVQLKVLEVEKKLKKLSKNRNFDSHHFSIAICGELIALKAKFVFNISISHKEKRVYLICNLS